MKAKTVVVSAGWGTLGVAGIYLLVGGLRFLYTKLK